MVSDIHVSTGLILKSLLCPQVKQVFFKETFERAFLSQNIKKTHNFQQHNNLWKRCD